MLFHLFLENARDLVAVLARQHDVEQHEVVAVLARLPERVEAVVRDVDDEPLDLETVLDGLDDVLIVLDDEYLVRSSSSDSFH